MFDEFFGKKTLFYNPLITKPKESLIYIDTQEINVIDEITKDLFKLFDRENIWKKSVDFGDYKIISPNGEIEYLLERKTATDFAASLSDKRAKEQNPELAEHPNGFLVIIGDIYQEELWPDNWIIPDSVTRYMSKQTLEINISGNRVNIIQVKNQDQFVILIDYIAKSLEKGTMTREVRQTLRKHTFLKKVSPNDPEIIKQMRISQLASISMCSQIKAVNIMYYFNGNYKKIQNATVEELSKVKLIGKVLAERIRKVYNDE